MWAALLVAAAVWGQAPAAEASTNAAEQQVTLRKLVRQLDSPRLQERQAAEEELLRLGPAALESLPKETESMSAEVQQRLGRIRQQLQQKLTASFAEPSHVTLLGDAVPLARVLDEFRKQTGNAIQFQLPGEGAAAGGPPVKVNFDKTPFWSALDQVLDQVGLKVYPYGNREGLQLIPRPKNEQVVANLVSYDGAFRFEVLHTMTKRVYRVPSDGSMELTIEASWEPRLAPISLDQQVAAIEAVDEQDKPIPVAERQAQLEAPVTAQTTAVEFQIPFQLPSREVKRIARLHGTLQALVPGKVETFRFGKLTTANNVPQRIGGATVTFQQARKNNDIWELRILVRYDDAAGALASHRTWMFNNEAYLQAADGSKVPYDTFESTSQEENAFGIAYLFALDKPLEDFQFVYQTPGIILAPTIRYEFRDIELP